MLGSKLHRMPHHYCLPLLACVFRFAKSTCQAWRWSSMAENNDFASPVLSFNLWLTLMGQNVLAPLPSPVAEQGRGAY